MLFIRNHESSEFQTVTTSVLESELTCVELRYFPITRDNCPLFVSEKSRNDENNLTWNVVFDMNPLNNVLFFVQTQNSTSIRLFGRLHGCYFLWIHPLSFHIFGLYPKYGFYLVYSFNSIPQIRYSYHRYGIAKYDKILYNIL